MRGKIVLLALILLAMMISIEPKAQGQTIQQTLWFQINPDSTFRSGDSLSIQVVVWDSLTMQNIATSSWLNTSPGSSFGYAVQFPLKDAVYGYRGYVQKKTYGGAADTSYCTSYFHLRVVDRSQGCSCISPANGSTLEVFK